MKKEIITDSLSGIGYLLAAICSTMALGYCFLYSTGNPVNLLFLFGLFYLYRKYGFPKLKERLGVCAFVGGVFLALVFTLGRVGRTNESILDALARYNESVVKDEYASVILLGGYASWTDKAALLVMFIGLWITFFFFLAQVMRRIGKMEAARCENPSRITERKLFWISVAVMFLCWLPYLVINYPGVLTWDSVWQIGEGIGVNPLDTKYPVVHTFLIAICYHVGTAISDANFGVAIYTVLQMIIMAWIYANLIKTLYKYGLRLRYCVLVLLYFAVVPFNAMYAITMWKDVLFGGFVLWFSTCIFQICVGRDDSLKQWIGMSVSGLLMIMFRTNGLIAYLLCCPFLLWMMRKYIKKMCLVLLLPLVINWCITNPLYDAIGIGQGNIVEALSIPLQHIARVVVDCEEELEPSQIERIDRLAPLDEMKNIYNCRYADNLKMLIEMAEGDKVIEEDKRGFLMLWLELALEHPVEYCLAEIDATVGYWYPDVQYNVVSIGGIANEYGIDWDDAKQELWGRLYQWCNLYRSIPILGCLYNMGTVFLLIVLIVLIQIYLKQVANILVSIPSIMVWCTIMIATPLHAEMRYVYSMMVTIPLIIGVFLLTTKTTVAGQSMETGKEGNQNEKESY